MQHQAVRPSPRETHNSRVQNGKQRSDLTQGRDVVSTPLPALLNRPENMAAKKKAKNVEGRIDEANLILSKHTSLGYIAFLTADSKIQKDAQAQFTAVRENYNLSHPVGLVLTYATLCKYYPDATAGKVLQLWKQAVEDWQILGDGTRSSYKSHSYKELEHLYGRDEKIFDREKNRKSLVESYSQREQQMRLLARQTGKQPFIRAVDAFNAAAFENITFQEAATNDVLLNTMFLANSQNLVQEDAVKREQFQMEKSAKYIDFPAKEKRLRHAQNEPDEMDLYLAQLEAQGLKNDRKNGRKNPREDGADRDPKKALAHTGGMLIVRTMQQVGKNIAKGLAKPV